MIITSLSDDKNGLWKVKKHISELQRIMSKRQSVFDAAGGAIMQQR